MNNDFNLNSTPIIKKMWEKRMLLLIVGVAAFVISAVVTLFIKNTYEATAIIMPPVANQMSKELFTSSQQEGLTLFGESDEAEQFQQIIGSRTLKDLVIDRLNLWSMWSINPQDVHAKKIMYETYDENVKVKSTKFEGVAVSVRDYSPEMAAIIANTIVDFTDSLMRNVKKQVAQKALEAYEEQYNSELEAIDALQDSMHVVMMAGVTSVEMQTKELTRVYAGAISSGNSSVANRIEKEMEPLRQYGSKYLKYKYLLEFASDNIVTLSNYLKVLRIEAQQEIPSQFVVDRAVAPDSKIAPKRSILVLVSTFAAVFFAVFVVVILDFWSVSLKKQQ